MGELNSTVAASGGAWRASLIAKNTLFAVVAGGAWLGLETGFFSPDRPTREQWEMLEKAKTRPAGSVVYQSNFALEKLGEASIGSGYWGLYNGATSSTVQLDRQGITVDYDKAAWLGAVFRLVNFEPRAIYRVSLKGEVHTEPAAMLVRNRQLDLRRETIPVGTAPFTMEFAAPAGRADRVYVIFMPNSAQDPKGSLRISSLKIERVGE